MCKYVWMRRPSWKSKLPQRASHPVRLVGCSSTLVSEQTQSCACHNRHITTSAAADCREKRLREWKQEKVCPTRGLGVESSVGCQAQTYHVNALQALQRVILVCSSQALRHVWVLQAAWCSNTSDWVQLCAPPPSHKHRQSRTWRTRSQSMTQAMTLWWR